MSARIEKVIYLALSLSLIGLIAFIVVCPRPWQTHKSQINIRGKMHLAEPSDRNFYETAYKFTKDEIDLENQVVLGGIIPHHLLAADIIAEFFSNLSSKKYDTIVLLSPNHFQQGKNKIITSNLNWQTPYGAITVDQDLVKKLLVANQLVGVEEDVFAREHGVKAEVAFIKKTWPQAKIIPLVLASNLKADEAENLARAVSAASNNKNVLVLASVDFSHYKTNEVAQEHDQQSISALESMDFNNVYKLDIDSPPSIYTLMKYAEFKNSSFKILRNSNSALLSGKLDLKSTTSYVSGYFIKDAAKKELAKNDSLKLFFWGDLMLDRNVKTKIDKYGFDFLFQKVATSSEWQNVISGDLVSANLEGAITNGGAHYDPIFENDFAFAPAKVSQFKKYGFNFFNIANNHLADQGAHGIIETRANLDKIGLNYSGCPDQQICTTTSKIVEIGGKKVAMVGLSMVYGRFYQQQADALIHKLASSTDLVIVNIHWGTEYQHQFNKTQQQVGHELMDKGADIIIGHHPHVVQGLEIYKGKPIFYSLGNFIFDQYFSADTQEGLGVGVDLVDNKMEFSLLPIKSRASQLELMAKNDKKKFWQKFVSWSVLEEKQAIQLLNGELILNK
jgi:AmmeMemoRadiSam system protein B